MLAAERPHPFRPYDVPLQSMSNSVRNDIGDMRTGRDFYVTPEVDRQLDRLERGVAHMTLDSNLLQSSPQWAASFNQGSISAEKTGAGQAVDRAAAVVSNVKNQMTKHNVSNMQDNQVREMHQWAMSSLQNAEQDLDPYKTKAVERISQFCDRVGVTDRFTGYRHNLNRGRPEQPKLGVYDRNGFTKPLSVSWAPQLSASNDYHSTRPSTAANTYEAPGEKLLSLRKSVSQSAPVSSRCIQERCGINMTFPGNTEYQKRYVRPPFDQPTKGFIVNPIPDYTLQGRPLAKASFERSNTEYNFRYEWPDGKKIVKLPWLRK